MRRLPESSRATQRELRAKLLDAARRRGVDVVLVWRLDKWGRLLDDLVVTLRELTELGVGFVSISEAFDMTTPTGRAMAGLLAVFAEFEREIIFERVRAGLAEARQKGTKLGRPLTVATKAAQIRKLYRAGASKAEIARRPDIGRTSVRRILGERDRPRAVLPLSSIRSGSTSAPQPKTFVTAFGLENALGYLIGEKLFTFLMTSERDPPFAAQVPKFVNEIRRIFTPEEIRNCLDRLERTKFLAAPDPLPDIDDPEDDIQTNPGLRIL